MNCEPLKTALGSIMTSDNVMEEMHQLCDVIGRRPTGSIGERKAKDYIRQRFLEFGLENVEAEPFSALRWRRGQISADIITPIERPISVLALPMNGSAKVRAEVVWAPFQTMEEYERIASTLKGKICINLSNTEVGLSGTMLHRSERIALAHQAGAVAFLWVANREGHILPTGSMSVSIAKSMPAFGITREDALLLRRLLERGDRVVVAIQTTNTLEGGTSWNLVGEIPGTAPEGPLVLLSAHYDSHDITEGAFDNAAGCAIVLEAARVLSEHFPRNECTLRFVIFSAEELGLQGSTSYVEKHLDELPRIRMLYNFDGLGVMPSSKYVHVPLRDDLVKYLQSTYDRFGFTVEVENALALNWDHAPFAIQGVPVASLTAKWPLGRLLHYGHTPSDSLDKIDPQDMRYLACCATLIGYDAAVRSTWSVPREDPKRVAETIRSLGKGHLLDRFPFTT